MRKLLTVILAASLLSSCMVTRTNVGDFKEQAGDTYTYSKGKQFYLLGVWRIGHVDMKTPSSKDCQITTRINVMDAIVTTLTAGIISSQTIKVLAKKPDTKK